MRLYPLRQVSIRMAAFVVALAAVATGLLGMVAPQALTAVRHAYFAATASFYCVGALRAAMGIVIILAASDSRAPRAVAILGVLMCLQAAIATSEGPERARAILDLESAQGPTVLRLGAAGALAAGLFLVFALTGRLRVRRGRR